jgi:hypothetical protein
MTLGWGVAAAQWIAVPKRTVLVQTKRHQLYVLLPWNWKPLSVGRHQKPGEGIATLVAELKGSPIVWFRSKLQLPT